MDVLMVGRERLDSSAHNETEKEAPTLAETAVWKLTWLVQSKMEMECAQR